MLTEVTTVLGDSLPVTRSWEDGSVECSWCHHPIGPELAACPNPWCDANPAWSAERLAARRAEEKEKRWEREEENRRAESVRAYFEASQAAHERWRERQTEEARRRGACLRCLFQPGWERVKFVRHRKGCPKEKR